MNALRGISAFVVPAGLLALAAALAGHVAALPPAQAALTAYAPIVALPLGILLAIALQRGRVLFALLSIGAAWIAYRGYVGVGGGGFTARAVFVSLCLLAPANLAMMALARERGIFNLHGALRAAILAAEIGLVAWFATSGNRETLYWLYEPLTTALLVNTRIPQMALLAMALGIAVCMWAWWSARTAVEIAFAAAILAWGLAALHPPTAAQHLIYVSAAALILAAAVLQDLYRMAFRDELTGVPGRRALNEHLARLSRRYAIAVIDIDHFKKFNDTHGHDVGDQVLKMVASRIERVRGGGKAYRFGGEEFVIVFAGATVAEAMPHLEALRVDVAGHGLTLRESDRAEAPPPKRSRKSNTAGKNLSVTISIGVAGRNENLPTPAEVLTAADKALYRAKHGGRNKVSQ